MIPENNKQQVEFEKVRQQLANTERYIRELEKRINFLERENTRRKSDVTQIVSALKR